MEKKPKISKEQLYEDYIIKNKSTNQIAKEYGYSGNQQIHKKLRKYNIKARPNYSTYSTSKCWKGYGEITGKYFGVIRHNAKERNLEFSITIEYIWDLFLKQERKCALSGIKLVFAEKYYKTTTSQTASLDRIDSSKGYIEGNVQWVHKWINIMKMDHTQEEFIEFCCKIADNYRKKNNDFNIS